MNQEKIVDISMLGVFTVAYQGGSVRESRYKDALPWQLMKYLAANYPRKIGKDELAYGLWDTGKPFEESEGAIRVRLRRLRESLNEIGLGSCRTGLILFANDCFFLSPDYEIRTDIQQIRQFVRFASEKSQSPQSRVAACRQALRLFRGRYLELSSQAEWMEPGRMESRKLFCDLTQITIELSSADPTGESMMQLAEKALLIVPDEVFVNTEIIRQLLKQGHFSDAVSHYSALTRILAGRPQTLPELSVFDQRRKVHETHPIQYQRQAAKAAGGAGSW